MTEREKEMLWGECRDIARQEVRRLRRRGFQATVWSDEDLIQEAGVVFSKLVSYYPGKRGAEFKRIFRRSFRNRLIDIGRKVNREAKYFVDPVDLDSDGEVVPQGVEDLDDDPCPWWEKIPVLPGQEEYVILKEEMKNGKVSTV